MRGRARPKGNRDDTYLASDYERRCGPDGGTGDRADHVLAFRRIAGEERLTCIVALRGGVEPVSWGNTALTSGEKVAERLRDSPVWVGLD